MPFSNDLRIGRKNFISVLRDQRRELGTKSDCDIDTVAAGVLIRVNKIQLTLPYIR